MASSVDKRLRQFLNEENLYVQIQSCYLPTWILRESKSRMVVIAKDKVKDESVILKIFKTEDEPGFLAEWNLPRKLPRPVVATTFLVSDVFAAFVFPFLKNAHRCSPRTSQMWWKVLEQLFEALVALHRENWAHLDVKPSNVLVRETGDDVEVFLIDFGCAERIELEPCPDVSFGDHSGTYPYVDPVFIETGTPSTKCDVWSVGVMVANSLLTDPYFPNERPSTSEFLKLSKAFPEHFQNNTDSIRQEMNDKDLIDVVNHLLVLDQEQRWSSEMVLTKISEIMQKRQELATQ